LRAQVEDRLETGKVDFRVTLKSLGRNDPRIIGFLRKII
jgi:hypothetical protein